MFNRENIRVRSLDEELEGIGLDPTKVMDDIERNAGLLEQHAGSPPASDAVRPLYEEDLSENGLEWDDDEDLEDDNDDEESEFLGEKMVRKKAGYRKDASGKLKKVSIQQKRKEKTSRRKKKGKLRTAAKMYAKRHKTQIKKRRAKRSKMGTAGKGKRWAMENSGVASQLQQLREELEQSNVNTGEPSPYEEAALNAGWLAHLLGECFEAMGDSEAGEMLYTMSDSAARLSEEIEHSDGELDENTEAKLTSILEGVTKALSTHEEIGSPSLFESIDMGVENGLYEDEEEDDDFDEELYEDEDEDFDFDDDEDDFDDDNGELD